MYTTIKFKDGSKVSCNLYYYLNYSDGLISMMAICPFSSNSFSVFYDHFDCGYDVIFNFSGCDYLFSGLFIYELGVKSGYINVLFVVDNSNKI